jgi:acetyl/propionyl-CoA carboxylase alpha subunit
LPSIGQVSFYRPASGPGVRVDDGIETGTQVSPYYDPMLAKVITYGDDRQEAIRKMVRALQDTVIFGVTTNIPYLLDILGNEEFMAGNVSTSFTDRHLDPWRPSADTSNSTWLSLAAYEVLRPGSGNQSGADGDLSRQDPWRSNGGWRNVS